MLASACLVTTLLASHARTSHVGSDVVLSTLTDLQSCQYLRVFHIFARFLLLEVEQLLPAFLDNNQTAQLQLVSLHISTDSNLLCFIIDLSCVLVNCGSQRSHH